MFYLAASELTLNEKASKILRPNTILPTVVFVQNNICALFTAKLVQQMKKNFVATIAYICDQRHNTFGAGWLDLHPKYYTYYREEGEVGQIFNKDSITLKHCYLSIHASWEHIGNEAN